MRVAIIQPWMNYLGGAQLLSLDMAREFKRQGDKVLLLTTLYDKDKFGAPGVNVKEVGIRRSVNGFLNFLPQMDVEALTVLNRFKKAVKRFKPDRVIVTNYPASLISGDRVTWYCLEAPFTLYTEKVNSIEYSINPRAGFRFPFLKKPFSLFEKMLIKRHNSVIAMSNRSNFFLKEIYNLPEAPIIHPGIKINNYNVKNNFKGVKKKFGIKSRNINFLVVSRIHLSKNVSLVLRAFKLLREFQKNVNLIVVGDGPELDNLKRFAKHHGLGVNFTGFVSEADKIGLYHSCDVVLFPPPLEPFGLVPVEAMACGKPVVALDAWGPAESVVEGETGFLVNNDVHDFMSAMLELAKSKKLRDKMGRAGRKRVKNEFSIEVMINRFKDYWGVG